MKKSIAILALLVALPVLTACDPRSYETEPVTVPTNAGNVVCQLYTRSIDAWDRSIGRPNGMNVAQADQICLNQGEDYR